MVDRNYLKQNLEVGLSREFRDVSRKKKNMESRCEKNDFANFVRILSNIYTVSQLFS